MAQTEKGIIYPYDYNEVADVPSDFKALAESIDALLNDYSLNTDSGNKIVLEMNSTTYKIKAVLKDKDDNVISTSNEIDLPLENMVTNISYNNQTLTLTHQDGQTTEVSIADLISDLASKEEVSELQSQVDDLTTLVETELDSNEVEGTEIDVSDSAEYRGRIEVKGNTEQEQLSGKNLLNTYAQKSTVVEGITVSVDDEGIITLNGTCTRNNTGINLKHAISGDGDIYTLKAEIIGGTYSKPSNDLRFNFHILSSEYNYEGLTQQFGEVNSITRNLIDGHIYDYLGFRVDLGIVLNNLRIKVQLEKGDTATDYEPYCGCGGQPSPNPDYPQPIKVVTGDNVVKHVGKNICPVIQVSGSKNGLSWIVNDDGTILINGTATAQTVVPIHNKGNNIGLNIKLKDNTDYVISNGANGNSAMFGFQCGYKIAGGTTIWSEIFNNKKITTTKDWVLGVGVIIRSGVTMNNVLIKPMIEEDTTATSYEPYREEEYKLDFGGKNIFDNTVEKKSAYPSTSVGSQVVYTNSNATDCYVNCCYLEAGKSYALSWKQDKTPVSTNKRIGCIVDDNNIILSTFDTWENSRTSRIITPSQSGYLILPIDKNATDIQIEEGTTATRYSPYVANPIELCKIGDYSDILFKNVVGDENYNAELESGAWYKKGMVGTISNSAGATWSSTKDGNSDKMRYNISNTEALSILPLSKVYSTHFVQRANNEYFTAGAINNPASGNITMSLGNSNGVSTFLAWFDENSVQIKYIRVNPTYTKITDPTLISQLEALRKAKWYKGVNHWWTETENLEPVLKGTYKQSNNLRLQALEQAVVALGGV